MTMMDYKNINDGDFFFFQCGIWRLANQSAVFVIVTTCLPSLFPKKSASLAVRAAE
jgi:hypothetical protein